jgi:hypothetical protein
MSATEERTRGEFIVDTLQPHHAVLDDRPFDVDEARPAMISLLWRGSKTTGRQCNTQQVSGKVAQQGIGQDDLSVLRLTLRQWLVTRIRTC